MENFIKRITKDVDLSFAILLSFCVYVFFALNIEVFFSHNISFAILERFAVLGLVGLALTICIIAGEIDLSIGSNAALCAVIVVKLTDPLGAPMAMVIGLIAHKQVVSSIPSNGRPCVLPHDEIRQLYTYM